MIRKKAFTLVELLIVIAIIAVLITILAPALQSAKEHATQAVCLGNQMVLVKGYLNYTMENKSQLPVGSVRNSVYAAMVADKAAGRKFYPPWCNPPLDENGNYRGGHQDQGQSRPPTLEERKRGCTTGVIYRYVKNEEAYHCPGDRRLYEGTWRNGQRSPQEYYLAYRSYQLPWGLTGRNRTPLPNNVPAEDQYKKLDAVSYPENKYCFVEDEYDLMGANFSYGCWAFEPVIGLQQWWDPIGVFHVDGCTLSYLDGHASKYKWKDDRSVQHGENRQHTRRVTMNPPNPDIDWFVYHYPIETPYRMN